MKRMLAAFCTLTLCALLTACSNAHTSAPAEETDTSATPGAVILPVDNFD